MSMCGRMGSPYERTDRQNDRQNDTTEKDTFPQSMYATNGDKWRHVLVMFVITYDNVFVISIMTYSK